MAEFFRGPVGNIAEGLILPTTVIVAIAWLFYANMQRRKRVPLTSDIKWGVFLLIFMVGAGLGIAYPIVREQTLMYARRQAKGRILR